jgi:hypothetical protein
MKILTKLTFFLLVSPLLISCGKDDKEPGPDLTSVKLSIASNADIFVLPAAMTSSNHPYAITARGYLNLLEDIFTENSEMLSGNQPGLSKSMSARLVALNADNPPKGTSFLLYTGQEPSTRMDIAYQLKDLDNLYSFEYLVSEFSKAEWYRYLYAEENKDQTSGLVKLYDNVPGVHAVIQTYTWTWSGDDFVLHLDSDVNFNGSFEIDYTINTKTHAGSVTFADATTKNEMTWDATGSGTYTIYQNSAVIDSGTW